MVEVLADMLLGAYELHSEKFSEKGANRLFKAYNILKGREPDSK